jgi:hypothetical protein
LLAGLFALSTPEARAGCNHSWLTQPTSPSALVDLKILTDDPGSDPSHPGSPASTPCARGACSRAPAIPPTSAEPAPRRAELWGSLTRPDPASPMMPAGSLPDSDPVAPRHRTIPPERPPR